MGTRLLVALLLVGGSLLWGCHGAESGLDRDGGDASVPDDGAIPGAEGGTGDGGGPPCLDLDGDGTCHDLDCDDRDPSVGPARAEVCGNGIDDNCDGEVDEGCLDGTAAFYVDQDSIGGTCADSNPGTLTAPWCTIAKANQSLAAGQTVYLRAGTYVDTIQPANSGLSDEVRITYSNFAGEVVTLTQAVYCIRLQSRSYVTVLGIKFLDCGRNLYLEASSHNNIGFCEFTNPGGPATWAGSRVYSGSQYNRIYHNVFSRYGSESGSAGAWDDNACILDLGNDNVVDTSDHNLVTNNIFSYGGHHILGVYSNYNVVRRNTFHNEEWYVCHQTAAGSLCGNRNVILNTSFPEENVRNVIEDNYIVFSGVPADQDTSAGLSVRTQSNIVRRNVFYYNDSNGVALSVDNGNTNDASGNHIYHNVIFHNGYPIISDWGPDKSGLLLARWVDDAAHNPMTGVAIKNNILHENQLYGIYYYYVNEAEQTVEGNWHEQGDPLFVAATGEPAPDDFTSLDFHLQPTSPCIDAGSFLTRTTGAGQDSTVLAVADAGYFTDGNGLVAGDLVQLEGQTGTALVVAVDFAANTITVNRLLTWAADTGVSLPYLGSRPDQGAFEHGL